MSCLYIWLQCSRDHENIIIKNVFKKVGLFLSSKFFYLKSYNLFLSNSCQFIYFKGFKFMILSKDTKNIGPKKNPDPDNIIKKKLNIKTKTIVFIRHGESDWNDIFNKGINISFIGRLINAFIIETLLLFHPTDSKFLDSPLNQEGKQ
jgi:hypothetical protein